MLQLGVIWLTLFIYLINTCVEYGTGSGTLHKCGTGNEICSLIYLTLCSLIIEQNYFRSNFYVANFTAVGITL